eukprot:jgi/Botrbrau1/23101/Bobra.0243s0038.2
MACLASVRSWSHQKIFQKPAFVCRSFSGFQFPPQAGISAAQNRREEDGTVNQPWHNVHVQLNPLQKTAVAVLSAVGAAIDPSRADLVAACGETTGGLALQWMRERMRNSHTGQLILDAKPRITGSTLRYASILPEGTFGHAYTAFMTKRQFSPDERPPVRFVDDAELAYVATRYREVHDLWHVLFACHTTVLGELALKAVEFVQTGMPMTGLSVVGANWRLKAEQRQRLFTELIPWAFRAGNRSADLMCLYYENHFHVRLTPHSL